MLLCTVRGTPIRFDVYDPSVNVSSIAGDELAARCGAGITDIYRFIFGGNWHGTIDPAESNFEEALAGAALALGNGVTLFKCEDL